MFFSLLPVCLWLGLFPLWQYGTYSTLTHDKWQGMLILTGVTLVCALTARLVRRRKEPLPRFRDAAVWMTLAWIGWMLLSALVSPYHTKTGLMDLAPVWVGSVRYEGFISQLCYGLILLGMLLAGADDPERTAVITTAVSLTLLCVVAALQYAGINALTLYPRGRSIRTNYEFQTTIGNIDMLSGVLTLLVPLVMVGYVRSGMPVLLLPAGLGMLLLAAAGVQGGLLTMGAFTAGMMVAALLRTG